MSNARELSQIATAIVVDGSKNVGIGTTSPTSKLDVSGEIKTLNDTAATGVIIKRTGGVNANGAVNFVGSDDAVDASVRMATDVANALVFTAGGATERMRIDSAGRVTTPAQPSFHVRVNNASYISTSPIPFSNVVFDVGSNFNASTYRFTAPVAGKYYMVLNLYLRTNNNEDAYPRFRVNGSNAQYSYFQNLGTGGQIDVTTSMNRIFNLAVNDYVDIVFATSGGGDYYGGNEETNWFGYLIG